jgi:hypothetical protein
MTEKELKMDVLTSDMNNATMNRTYSEASTPKMTRTHSEGDYNRDIATRAT